MKKLILGSILVIALAACETQRPAWQQELDNMNRQWRDHNDPVKRPEKMKNPREEFKNPSAVECAIR